MYRILIFAFFQMGFLSAKLQNVQFRCYVKSNCDKTITELDNYSIRKGIFVFHSLSYGNSAILPDTGVYVLVSPKISEDSLIIHVDNYGLNADTIRQRELYSVLVVDSKPGEIRNGDWLYCGKLCNGYMVDFYNNGNKYLEGVFKRGKPVGFLRYYSENGALRYIEYYNRRGRKVRSEYTGT